MRTTEWRDFVETFRRVVVLRNRDAHVSETTCAWLGKGFCAASVDGYCVGGYDAPDGQRRCHR
jgi:hypothetical protein